MKVLHLDTNHPLLLEQFAELGFENHQDYDSTKEQVEKKIHVYDGIIIRSRFTIDQQFLESNGVVSLAAMARGRAVISATFPIQTARRYKR